MERLQKVLARAGFGSRRECEKFITEGRVSVNGRVITTLGTKANLKEDVIKCDGKIVRPRQQLYFMLHKPKGYISTSDDNYGRRKTLDLIKGVKERLFTVGRLDADSEGLIIVTNDGELCNLLTHPRYQTPKTYFAVVEGNITPDILQKIQNGVWLSDGKTSPMKLHIKKRERNRTFLELTLKEGMNREIRRAFAKFGLKVTHLKRIKIGDLELRNLGIGKFRLLTSEEINKLKSRSFQK